MAKAKAASEIDQLRELGMSNEEIKAVILAKARQAGPGAVTAIPAGPAPEPQNARQRMDQANLGPDPELVRRHQEFLKTYKPPVLEETFEVTLDKRRADYVRRWAGWQSAIRKGEVITPERAIDLMVRRLWQLDPDRSFIDSNARATVPRSHFQAPAFGTPPSVPQG
jgi:hypothetical protein